MPEASLVTPVDPKTLAPEPRPVPKPVSGSKLPLIFAVIVLAGVLVGYFLSRKSASTSGSVISGQDIIKTANEVGSTDTVTFRDTATGTLEAGGSNGEGTHKLIRDGGPSQTVYLVSSIVDLDEYVGKKVQVWGETIRAQRVGWLMDVGRLKISD
jgi:hypothetical protein